MGCNKTTVAINASYEFTVIKQIHEIRRLKKNYNEIDTFVGNGFVGNIVGNGTSMLLDVHIE